MLRNPVHLTGLVRHCWLWATSSSADIFIPNPDFNPDTEVKTSIYCVHGTADRNASFSLIADRLQGKLPENIDGIHLLAFDDRMRGTAVEEFAVQLKNKIMMNNSERVILMGHSRGGLIISWFAEYLAAENNIGVDLIVPICGPFRGSYLALWPLTQMSSSVNEMTIDSGLLKDLSEKIRESHHHYLFFGAEKDHLVLKDCWMPYHLDRAAENCYLLDRHGHLSMMSSHRLVNVVARRIRLAQEDVMQARQQLLEEINAIDLRNSL